MTRASLLIKVKSCYVQYWYVFIAIEN